MLSQDDFYTAGKLVNLTSVDLLVIYDNKYIVGKRINNPAKGYYFVPGGVIQKNETISNAIKRISKNELNIELDNWEFHKVTQHWYENNFRDDKYGTHYLSLSYKTNLTSEQAEQINICDQHSDTKWLTLEELLQDNEVHKYSKIFFE